MVRFVWLLPFLLSFPKVAWGHFFYLLDCPQLMQDAKRLAAKRASVSLLRRHSRRYLSVLRQTLYAQQQCRFRQASSRQFFRTFRWYRPQAKAPFCHRLRLPALLRRNARYLARYLGRIDNSDFRFICQNYRVGPRKKRSRPVVVPPPPSREKKRGTSRRSVTPRRSLSPRPSPSPKTPSPALPPRGASSSRNFARQLEAFALYFRGKRYCLKAHPNIRYCLDCSKLVQVVYGWLGRRLPRTVRRQMAVTVPIDPNRMRVGDLVLFSSVPGGPVKHIGLILSGYRMIHAVKGMGVIVDNLNRWAYGRRYRRVYFAGARRVY